MAGKNNGKTPTFHVEALGCPSSQYEGEALRSLLIKAGFQEISSWTAQENKQPPQAPDVYLVNTCAVTETAVRKVRKAVRQAKKLSPRTMIVLTGCYPQLFSREITSRLPEVEVIAGVEGRNKLPSLLQQRLEQRNAPPWSLVKDSFPEEPLEELVPEAPHMVSRKMRPVIKIQEGCPRSCSYCIVTHARGKPRSLSPDTVINLAENLLEKGHREIVLAGTNLGLYGYGEGSCTLTGLLEQLVELPYRFRLRLSYLEPGSIKEELIQLIGQSEKICPYLYLPLQSASNQVLERMERGYTVEDVENLIKHARQSMPDISIQSDLIVGFPGETGADHLQTIQQTRRWELSGLHIFSFSSRPRTRAASLEGKVHPEIIKERYREMRELHRDLAKNFHRKMQGKTLRVLVEKAENGWAEGYSDNYIRVIFPLEGHFKSDSIKGNLVTVKPVKFTPEGIKAQLLNYGF